MQAMPVVISKGRAEEISILLLMVKGLHKQFNRQTFLQIPEWYRLGIKNWAHADTMGMMVLPLFFKKNLAKLNDFSSWIVAENKYQRRSVPVTLIKLLKDRDSFKDLFSFIEVLMTDPDREVHQGVGWFLREAWKRKPLETEAFLMKWKEISPRLIFQYATEKMTSEEKSKFKKSGGKKTVR
jgi:3-methyladenine DNA glycosylase AlkD